MRVAVGMSGGVDSSVAALLLKEKGYDVIGVTLKLSSIVCSNDIQVCCSPQDIKDAKRVASYLGIEHYVIDWEDIFREKVINYFVEEYKKGKTPNPCSVCNREVKTGRLAKFVNIVLGADKFATGHYIKIEDHPVYGKVIKRGSDIKKDQSYFMALLERDVLDLLIFPLSDLTKEEVRKIAEDYKIPVSQKKESFEICFTAGKTPAEYLLENNLLAFESGDIVHIDGKTVGKHKGLPFYTVGQRRGLGVRWREPLYVIEKDAERNTVVVGEREKLLTDHVSSEDFNFLVPVEKWKKEGLSVQGRYRQKAVKIKDVSIEGNRLTAYFEKPEERFAKGQVLAVYDGDILLGGGIIV
ncbi:MAG TPA: tRNA 2-thiouridine(34) synthase MnmA [Persephonella sp.]|uniref:tRNA-specific 2-thiouridylase MnmA n=1 Tax=Persephonella marina (strain DSM 14350 / EX-H1) TaxID=123214 RepID=MNMA_PERMH|nr:MULTISPECIES: tRNA 2-thiouridine(34) synthase MnmA [Persephonella]C0QRH5.1 RecName: Full=tRNA-specific 2-thiouridylase MnmA [Persephonella marina EX-H1]ACO04751.1 tRNA (5-methylaminomethyl-2-thiouridylate)-methyltransferase [Persephonella marina EX-H1]HCB69016.1 tRNA 2-thiouridine(34) synthase MnmA [Persephonella sp.]